MKQRTSFILKGLISLVLSLVMLCGTAVTSLSAVTVDLAETGALTPVTGNLDTTKEYYLCSENYTIEYSSGGWIVKNNSNNYIIGFNNASGPLWGTKNAANKFTLTKNGTQYYSNSGSYYLTYSNNSLGYTTMSRMADLLNVYEKSSATGYTVSFDGNDGTGSMSAVQNVSGSYILPSNGFTAPTNKSFAGWKANNTGDTLAAGASYTVNADVTFYAQWTESGSTPSDPTEAPSEPSTEPSTGDGSITYKKQIEKKYPTVNDDYNYRLHLTVDGSSLKGSTSEVTPGSGESTGIVLLIDITKDFNATTSDNQSKLTVIQNIVNNYINQFAQNQRNKISVILVKGEQSGSIDSNGTVELKKAWDNNQTITLSGSTVHYTANFKAGLVKAGKYLSSAGTDKTAVVFITNSNPQFSVHDDGSVITNQQGPITDENAAKTDILNYLPTFFSTYNTDLHILDVEQESEEHETPQAMGEYIESVGKGTYRTAGSSQELIDSFDEIIETIIPGDKTKNITVTDTLSQYVDFAENKDLTATLYTGTNPATTYNVSDAVTVSGKTVTFEQSRFASITGLNSLSEIEGPFKLEIAFDIKTTAVGQNYTDTGDLGTDYSSDSYDYNFSAGKQGYYSNSTATITYTLNNTQKSGTFIKPVVQAPAEPPVQGAYIFKYADRNATNNVPNRTVTVPVTLNSSEKNGYSGNGNQKGVPTYIWNTDSQNLFDHNPLLTAALVVQGNAENWKNVDVYKNTIAWGIGDNGATNMEFDATAHTLTVTADVEPIEFTVNAYNGSTALATVTNVPYGDVVTFHKQYEGAEGCHYVDVTIPDGFTYWSSDPEGNFLLTTNPTFGMVIRGNVNEPDSKVVNVYLQTKAIPATDPWKPEIEESKLTYSNDDDTAEQKYYADYLANYFSVDGSVIQDKIASGETVEYGLLVVKSDFNLSELDQAKMISALTTMRSENYESAYLNNNKTRVAYRYEYNDGERISNFNRTWYTITGSQATMGNKKLTAMAYVVIDGHIYYSAVDNKLATAASN